MSYRLLERVGIEIEYTIVDAGALDVRPIADRLLMDLAGQNQPTNDVERGPVSFSNELVAHVIEMKLSEPATSLVGLPEAFGQAVADAQERLRRHGARLLGGGAHPWMDPRTETVLWPHEGHEIYSTFHRLFDCYRHGWANLQSMHLNLSFANDVEFGRLHGAVRLVLPLLPALAASSPFLEGRATPHLDGRLEVYRKNSAKLPEAVGQVIPEPLADEASYTRVVYEPIARGIERLDHGGVLEPVWTNARGAIARFDRGSIEIRILDVQECPRADLSIAAAVVALVRALCDQGREDLGKAPGLDTALLAQLLDQTIRDGEEAVLDAPTYLERLGLPTTPTSARHIWEVLLGSLNLPPFAPPVLTSMLRDGPLARRLRRAAGPTPDRPTLQRVYTRLADCMDRGELFTTA